MDPCVILVPLALRVAVSRDDLSRGLVTRTVCDVAQPTFEAIGYDFGEQDAYSRERDTGECGGDLKLGPDHNGYVVPGGID